jgi:glycosyltransferase involved in cell wall biosynthesis
MMKILYLHQYFRLPEEAGSHRSWYIAKALAEKGHQVEIITASSDGKAKKIQVSPNIQVYYLPVYYHQSMSFWRRVWAFIVFFLKAFRKAIHLKNIDKVYATSTPLSVGILAWLLCKTKKIPYIFEVRDLWPLVPIEMGFIKGRIFQKILFFLEKKIYLNSLAIVVLSPPMEQYVRSIVAGKPTQVTTIPNMSDCEIFHYVKSEYPQKKIKIAYIGSIGKANALERFIEIAPKTPEMDFYVIGKGAELENIRNKAKDMHNVFFIQEQSKQEIQKILESIEAIYISFADYSILETCSPNKFFDGLAAGKLCITNTQGWIKELIEERQCGFYAKNAQEFRQKIMPFLKDTQLLDTYQQNARILAEKQFDKNILCSKIVSLVEST